MFINYLFLTFLNYAFVYKTICSLLFPEAVKTSRSTGPGGRLIATQKSEGDIDFSLSNLVFSGFVWLDYKDWSRNNKDKKGLNIEGIQKYANENNARCKSIVSTSLIVQRARKRPQSTYRAGGHL
jgi:hypothetical protein